MSRNYTKITRCPDCGSKRLKVSEYYGQVWNKRLLKGEKLSKGRKHTYLNTDYAAYLSCQDCGLLLENDDTLFRISEEGDILIADDYLEELKKLQEE